MHISTTFEKFFQISAKLLSVLPQEINSLQISVQSLSVDLSAAHRCCHGNPAELFSVRNVGNMNLHLGDIHAGQRIPDGVAVVRIGTGIDHNPLRIVKIGFLDPVNDGSLMIALKDLNIIPGLLRLFVDQIQ